jgi:hypothetical protein
MHWILVLQIALTTCQGALCQLSQPASVPFASYEACENLRVLMQTCCGDGTTATLQDTHGGDTHATLTLRWACVPARLTPAPAD